MSAYAKLLRFILFPLFGIISLCSYAAQTADSVILYTPYTKISVPPGEAIEYPVDIINNSNEIRNLELSVAGLPKGWNYSIKSGNWEIGQLSVLPSSKSSFLLRIDVPLKVRKGSYRFKVMAGGSTALPLTVIVSQEGTFKTELTTQQSNMEGHPGANFTFTAILNNRTTDKQL